MLKDLPSPASFWKDRAHGITALSLTEATSSDTSEKYQSHLPAVPPGSSVPCRGNASSDHSVEFLAEQEAAGGAGCSELAPNVVVVMLSVVLRVMGTR